jgi:tetratricopeptide (TPR) repeat protein
MGASGQRGLAPGEKDSLWTVWNNEAETDSVRLKAIQRIAWHGYLFSQPDSAYYYATLQYNFAEERGQLKPLSSALNIQATALNFQGDYDNALEKYARSLEIGRELGDIQGVGVCLNNMGNIYKNQGLYSRAIEYFFESLQIREEIGDQLGTASSLGNISNVYKAQGDNEQSLTYALKCLEIMEELDNLQGVAGTLNNIGLLHESMGDFEAALGFHERSLAIRETIGDKRGVTDSMINVGTMHQRKNEYDEARQAFIKSLELAEATVNPRGVARALYHLGYLEKANQRYQAAIAYAERALPIAREAGDIQVIGDVSGLLYDNYKLTNQYEQALAMHELHISMQDSILREENQRELLQRQFRYDFDKREVEFQAEQERKDALAREAVLKQRSQRNMLGLGFIVLLLIGGGSGAIFYQRKKAQYRYRSILLELKAVKAQISPHFFFNAMNSVVNMITSNRSEEAEEFLVKYARLMRQTLRDSDRELTTLKDEIDVLTNYLELEVIRLAGRFTFTFQVDERLDPEEVLIPSMLIQPLVENAIWHGVAPLDGGGEICISFKPERDLLHVAVEDNGVGRAGAKEQSSEPAGSSITAQRIALYNARYGGKGELKLTDAEQGVRAEFRVPLLID